MIQNSLRVIVFLGQINSSCSNLLYVSHKCELKCAYIFPVDNRASQKRLHLLRRNEDSPIIVFQNIVRAQILLSFYIQANRDTFSLQKSGPALLNLPHSLLSYFLSLSPAHIHQLCLKRPPSLHRGLRFSHQSLCLDSGL